MSHDMLLIMSYLVQFSYNYKYFELNMKKITTVLKLFLSFLNVWYGIFYSSQVLIVYQHKTHLFCNRYVRGIVLNVEVQRCPRPGPALEHFRNSAMEAVVKVSKFNSM